MTTYQSDGYFGFPSGLHVHAYVAAIWFVEIGSSKILSIFCLTSMSESRKTILYNNDVIMNESVDVRA